MPRRGSKFCPLPFGRPLHSTLHASQQKDNVISGFAGDSHELAVVAIVLLATELVSIEERLKTKNISRTRGTDRRR